MKKTTKENPITTFRKNFETRSKTVMSSLKKAQTGGSTTARSVDTNEYGSTGEVEKTKRNGNQKLKTVEISNYGSSMTNPSSTPTARIDKQKYDANGMEGSYKTKNISVAKAQRKINRIGKRATAKTGGYMKTGGPVKKMEDGGIFTPDGRLKSKKTRNVDTGFNPNSSVSRTKRNGEVVTKSITTSQGFVPSASKTKTITDKEGAIKSEKTKDIGWNSALRKINRVDKNAGRNKNDTYTYKTGGAAKATKFAALAKPFNKATAADRIAGAKKNASKKK